MDQLLNLKALIFVYKPWRPNVFFNFKSSLALSVPFEYMVLCYGSRTIINFSILLVQWSLDVRTRSEWVTIVLRRFLHNHGKIATEGSLKPGLCPTFISNDFKGSS